MNKASALIILLVPLVVLGYDACVGVLSGYDATLTAVVRSWNRDWPVLQSLAAVAGLGLWWHFFGRP